MTKILKKITPQVIKAKKGKVFKRISDGIIYGNEVSLGYTYMINGKLLQEPLLELPEHFVEVDATLTDEAIILDEDIVLVDEEENVETENAETEKPVERQRVTLADYRELEKEVQQLKQIIEKWQG